MPYSFSSYGKMLLTLGFGLLISLAVFYTVKSWEDSNRMHDFNFAATDHTNAIKAELHHIADDLTLARKFTEAAININHVNPNNPAEFMHFAETAMANHAGMESITWAVPQTSTNHQQALKVLYQTQSTPENKSGTDHENNHADHDPLDSSKLLHPKKLLSALVSPDNDELTFIAPVSNHPQSDTRFTGNHIGSLMVEMNIQDVVEHAIAKTPVGGLDIQAQLFLAKDLTPTLYNHPSRSRTANEMDVKTGMRHATKFNIAGQQWIITYEAAPQFLRKHPAMLAWQSLALCVLLTLMFTVYDHQRRKQSLIIQQQVAKRTKEIVQSKQKLRRIMDHLQDVYFQVDDHGILHMCSPSVRQLIDYTEQEVLNTHITQYYANPDSRKELLADLRHSANGQLFKFETQARHKNGQAVWVSCNIQYMYDEQGKPNGIEGFVRDISAKKQREQENLNMHRQIEHTQRLESLGVMAGGIAHDFNNLLAAIMGNASLASRKLIDPSGDSKKHLSQIIDASKQAAGLCQQMLAYAGKGRFIIEPVNLSLLLNEMSELLRVSTSSNVRLFSRLQDPLPYIQADKTQIEQVILNFVINASEAIEGKGEIILRTGVRHLNDQALKSFHLGYEQPKADDYVFLSVLDTGCGMNQATIDKIFDPFFTTKFTGRGLGMSAVLGIVKGHHGLLRCESKPGKGTVFTVFIPKDETEPDPSPSNEDTGSFSPNKTQEIKTPMMVIQEDKRLMNSSQSGHDTSGEMQKTKHTQCTALVIDDELFIRVAAKSMIESMKWKSICAADGVSGVELFKKHQKSIGIVLLDMTMPGMDGLATFDAIIAIDPDAKVILSTGYSEGEAKKKFDGKGLAGFLQKPYTVEQLHAKFANIRNTTS